MISPLRHSWFIELLFDYSKYSHNISSNGSIFMSSRTGTHPLLDYTEGIMNKMPQCIIVPAFEKALRNVN